LGENKIKYQINFSCKSSKEFTKLRKKLNKKLVNSIYDSIDNLKTNPNLGKELVYNLKKTYSIRVQDYRIIYKFESSNSIIILAIKHRKNIYD
jgi:addiction module RelE/StbE family toxin